MRKQLSFEEKVQKYQIKNLININNQWYGYSEKYKKWYNISRNKFANSKEIQEVIKKSFQIKDEEILQLITSRTSPQELFKINTFWNEIKYQIRYSANSDTDIWELFNKYEIKGSAIIDRKTQMVIVKNSAIARKLKKTFEIYYEEKYSKLNKLYKKGLLSKEVIDTLKIFKDKTKRTKILRYAELKFKRRKTILYRITVEIINVKRYSIDSRYISDWIDDYVESGEPISITIYASKIKGSCWRCGIAKILEDHFGIEVPIISMCYVDERYVSINVEKIQIDWSNIKGLAFKNIYAINNCSWWLDIIIEGLR